MQIYEEIINFFGLDMIQNIETFPDLIQCIIHLFLACALVLYIIRALCAMSASVANRMH